MFKDLKTSTKLALLTGSFGFAILVAIYSLCLLYTSDAADD